MDNNKIILTLEYTLFITEAYRTALSWHTGTMLEAKPCHITGGIKLVVVPPLYDPTPNGITPPDPNRPPRPSIRPNLTPNKVFFEANELGTICLSPTLQERLGWQSSKPGNVVCIDTSGDDVLLTQCDAMPYKKFPTMMSTRNPSNALVFS